MNIVRDLFAALGCGITKAAEVLCPMDHTAVRRARAVCDAAEAAADALADAEAERDVWEPSCGHPNHGNADHCCRPFLPCDGGCCKPVEDVPPLSAAQLRMLADAMDDFPGEVEQSGPLAAKPSPGDLTDAELFGELAFLLEVCAPHASPRAPGLIAEAKARAAAEPVPTCAVYLASEGLVIRPDYPIFCELPAGHAGEHISYKHPDRAIIRWPNKPASVSHEDLAAHITASLLRADKHPFVSPARLADHAAGDLLSDYRISKK